MSIPLPPIYNLFHNPRNAKIKEDEIPVVNINDLYLDAEERYEIFQVKAAERPHLLNYNEESSCTTNQITRTNHEHLHETKNNYDEGGPMMIDPPLVDGCDLPGWRKEQLASSSRKQTKFYTCVTMNETIQSLLNVGPSSTMFRLESQWPNVHKMLQSTNSRWNEMKNKLLIEPKESDRAIVVEYEDCCQLVEIENDNGCESLNSSTNGGDSIDCRTITKFAMEFEQTNIPAKILGATKDWICMPKNVDGDKCSISNESVWTFDNLVKRYGNVYWRFSDTHGEMMSMKTYAKYIYNVEGLLDDSPLGIYDAEFGDDDSPTCEMINEYQVPECFSPDIFNIATTQSKNRHGRTIKEEDEHDEGNDDVNDDYDDDVRPPWRWILVGPERSGTGLHIDPLWTNAWVTVIEGMKRWLLFPPNTPKDKIGMDENSPQINSATWFHNYYDKVTSFQWPVEYKPVEVLQVKGETVFVPNGWPHIVLNLATTVAVTHNYASEFGPFERMWLEVAQDEPEFAERWLEGMKLQRPDLYHRVLQIHSDGK